MYCISSCNFDTSLIYDVSMWQSCYALLYVFRRRTNSKEPRSGLFPAVTKSATSESPYGMVAMETATLNNSSSEDYGTMASKTTIEYASLDILSNSSSPNHCDSGDNNIVYSNSSQTPSVEETAQYGVVDKQTRRI